MKQEIGDWLLNDSPWMTFAVETQLLQLKADPTLAIQSDDIQFLLERINSIDKGFETVLNGTASYKSDLFRDVFFLADIGFTAEDLGLEDTFSKVMALEDFEHRFILSKEMKPNYFCISSILLTAMVKMSPTVKEQLRSHLNVILDAQRLDGGWHCSRRRAVGQSQEDTVSCPMENLNVLMLLGQYEEYRNDSRFNGAIDLLLSHWERKEEKRRPYGFGVGTQYCKLKYPDNTYSILRVLSVLSLYPYALKRQTFKDMLAYVHKKSPNGKYTAESIVRSLGRFDFGQKQDPSRWITFLVECIDNRVQSISP